MWIHIPTSGVYFSPADPALAACASIAFRCSSGLAVRVSTTPTRLRSP